MGRKIMKKNFVQAVAISLGALSISLASATAQPRTQATPPNLSAEEQKLATSIASAPDPATKLKAAAELISKYPKTSIRQELAENLARRVASVKDNAQKLALAQQLQTIFNDPGEADVVGAVLVQAYADTNQPDQAFAKGAELLSRAPDALDLLVQLSAIGTDQVKGQNPKFIPQTIQYASHAIEMFEADKKPAGIDDARWQNYKTTALPGLYQTLGLLYFAKGDAAKAKIQYTKAAQLKPIEPFNFVMLGALLNEEYQNEAKSYQSMPPGPATFPGTSR